MAEVRRVAVELVLVIVRDVDFKWCEHLSEWFRMLDFVMWVFCETFWFFPQRTHCWTSYFAEMGHPRLLARVSLGGEEFGLVSLVSHNCLPHLSSKCVCCSKGMFFASPNIIADMGILCVPDLSPIPTASQEFGCNMFQIWFYFSSPNCCKWFSFLLTNSCSIIIPLSSTAVDQLSCKFPSCLSLKKIISSIMAHQPRRMFPICVRYFILPHPAWQTFS